MHPEESGFDIRALVEEGLRKVDNVDKVERQLTQAIRDMRDTHGEVCEKLPEPSIWRCFSKKVYSSPNCANEPVGGNRCRRFDSDFEPINEIDKKIREARREAREVEARVTEKMNIIESSRYGDTQSIKVQIKGTGEIYDFVFPCYDP